jgi:hypothetical protein
MSSNRILPLGPVPLTEDMSIPSSSAVFFAKGETKILLSSFLSGIVGLELEGLEVSSFFTSFSLVEGFSVSFFFSSFFGGVDTEVESSNL